MVKRAQFAFAAVVMGLCSLSPSHATLVTYSAEPLGGLAWRYIYEVANNSLEEDIGEFTVYFDRSLYSSLAVEASPSGWDSVVVPPDDGIPADGFFDSLALVDGIAPHASVGGFSVTFDYSGAGVPGSQFFEVVDASFQVLDSGMTTPIPEPQSYLLLVAGLAILACMRGANRRCGRGRVTATPVF